MNFRTLPEVKFFLCLALILSAGFTLAAQTDCQQDPATCLTDRAISLRYSRNFDSIFVLLDSAFLYLNEPGQYPNRIRALSYKGLIQALNGEYSASLVTIESAIKEVEEREGPESVELVTLYARKSQTLADMGDHEAAIEYKKLGLYLNRINGREIHSSSQTIHFNLGFQYFLIEADSLSLYHFNKSEEMFNQLPPDDPGIFNYSAVGYCYSILGDFDKARFYMEKEMALQKENQGTKGYDIANIWVDLAGLYWAQGQIDQATDCHWQARKALFNQPKDKELSQLWANLYFDRMRMFQQLGIPDSMLVNSQLSLRYQVSDFHPKDVFENPPVTGIYEFQAWMGTMECKLQALDLLFRKTQNARYLGAILNTTSCIHTAIIEAKSRLTSEYGRLYLNERGRDFNDIGMGALMEMHRRDPKPVYVKGAFMYAAQHKFRLLLDGLQQLEEDKLLQIPDSLSNQWTDLNIEIQGLQEQIESAHQQSVASEKILSLEDGLGRLKIKRESMARKLKQSYPAFFQLNAEYVLPSFGQLQASLTDDHTAYLEYHLGSRGNYVFVLTPTGINSFRLPPDSVLQTEVNVFLQAVRTPPTQQNRSAEVLTSGYQLYQYLLEPVISELNSGTAAIERLRIVPDRYLGALPFEALVTQAVPSQSLKSTTPFLLQDFQIDYGYSSFLLYEVLTASRQPPSQDILAFAPLSSGIAPGQIRDDATMELPGSRQELDVIHELFEGDYLTGTQAQKDSFLHFGKQPYGAIHLAQHGKVDPHNPMLSHIQFTTGDSLPESGRLYAYELHSLSMQADLVVLSACETGVGEFVVGEGIVSLARGFMYAGVPAEVYSLWKLDDAVAPLVMAGFYRRLEAGTEKDAALHQSKLEYLTQADQLTAHPYYWAPFVFNGDPRALVPPPQKPDWLLSIALIVGVFLFVAAIFFWRKRKKSSSTTS